MRSYSVSCWLTDLKFEGSRRDSSVELFSARGPKASVTAGRRTRPSSRPEGRVSPGSAPHTLPVSLGSSHHRLYSHRSRASKTSGRTAIGLTTRWVRRGQSREPGRGGRPSASAQGGGRCPRGVWLASWSCSPADLRPQQPHAPFPPQVIWENFTLDTEKGDHEEILTVQEVTVAPASVGTA